jgi:hypothetical protein
LVSLGLEEREGIVEGTIDTEGIGDTEGRVEGMELVDGFGLIVGKTGISPDDGAILWVPS